MPTVLTNPPKSLSHEREALALLDRMSAYTDYNHGRANPYLAWLKGLEYIPVERVRKFLSIWWSVSKHQPQVLLLCAAAHFEREERRRIILENYIEEDGFAAPDHDAHYDLLERLIEKLGGPLMVNARSERMAREFLARFGFMSPARAAGVLAGVEHPALDISAYLHRMVSLCGFARILDEDLYLKIHVNVEPMHIFFSHSTAEKFIEAGGMERKEAIAGFHEVMEYWRKFWPFAFQALGYTNEREG